MSGSGATRAPARPAAGGGAFIRGLRLVLERRLADQRPDPPGHIDHVGVGLLVDVDLHAHLTIGVGEHLAVALAVHHLAKVFHADLAAVAAEDDCVRDFVESLVFVDGADHVFRAALADTAAGGVDVLRPEPPDDIVDGEVNPLQFGLVDEDVNLLLQPAADPRRRHPGDRLDGALDLQLRDASQPPLALVPPVTLTGAG